MMVSSAAQLSLFLSFTQTRTINVRSDQVNNKPIADDSPGAVLPVPDEADIREAEPPGLFCTWRDVREVLVGQPSRRGRNILFDS